MDEFEAIQAFFSVQPVRRADVALGIGDDAALLRVPAGQELVATTDTLVANVHFLADTDPADLGYRALAVNLSDLAAMGAEAAWATLSLTLPAVDADWLTGFCRGFYELASEFQVQLVGGNLARGPLNVTVGAYGYVPEGMATTRSGARPGDAIFVTGTLGDAALALNHLLGRHRLEQDAFLVVRNRFLRPQPRVREALQLRGVASASIDVSDGLLADLGHVLEASGLGAQIELGRLPLSDVYQAARTQVGWEPALSQGDDYELCFTVPTERIAEVKRLEATFGCAVTQIGETVAQPGLTVLDVSGRTYSTRQSGHDHFRQLANEGS